MNISYKQYQLPQTETEARIFVSSFKAFKNALLMVSPFFSIHNKSRCPRQGSTSREFVLANMGQRTHQADVFWCDGINNIHDDSGG